MSRFPKLTETFILYEILELERQGTRVELFALVREREPVAHPEARALASRAHFARPSPALALAQLHWLRRRPLAYLRAWLRALAGNTRSPKFLLRALAVVPQAAWLALVAERLGIEHIHAHWATHPALAAYVIRELAGLPYSFTAHAHDLYVDRPMLAEKLRRASFAVTISEYNRRLLAGLYGPLAEKVRVVRCGVDTGVFAPRQARPERAAPVIVCVASLQPYKGHATLLDALALLRDAGQPFRCLMVGEGELRPAIETQAARLGLGDAVELLGRQPSERVRAILDDADIVVQPSVTAEDGKREGIPVALMEALACGLPAVASDLSGVPELVIHRRTGLLVAERDAAALAEALLELCRDEPLRRELGRAGRAHVLRHFSLGRNVAALRALLLDRAATEDTERAEGQGSQTSAASVARTQQ